jgi:hypothetical protein
MREATMDWAQRDALLNMQISRFSHQQTNKPTISPARNNNNNNNNNGAHDDLPVQQQRTSAREYAIGH